MHSKCSEAGPRGSGWRRLAVADKLMRIEKLKGSGTGRVLEIGLFSFLACDLAMLVSWLL